MESQDDQKAPLAQGGVVKDTGNVELQSLSEASPAQQEIPRTELRRLSRTAGYSSNSALAPRLGNKTKT